MEREKPLESATDPQSVKTAAGLTESELEALREQLRASVSGGTGTDLYADAFFHDNSNCGDGHSSHSQVGSHS
jgi:hypothetical protein